MSAHGRYCCKSPKLPGANFSAVKKPDRRPPVDMASITLPRSPASLSSSDEGPPHLYTKVACTAKRNFDHECKKTFSTASVKSGGDQCSRIRSALPQSSEIWLCASPLCVHAK